MSAHAKDAAANAAETALVRARWSEFVTTDKVERVMANAGKATIYDWETGNADDLLAAVGAGAAYVRTSRPLEARAIIGAQAAKARRGAKNFPPYDCKQFIPGIVRRATGAFRTEQDPDGRWWLVDPLGRGFLSFGVQSANWQGCYDPAHDRYAYRETNIKQFGTPKKWAEDTIKKYTAWGFNTLSFGCGSELDYRGVPRIRVARFGQMMCHVGMPEEYWINDETRPACAAFPNVFHPRFAEICALVANWMCAPYRDDPWTIGYYLDNELAWGRGRTAPGVPKPENWVRAHGADPAGKVPDEVKRGFLLEIARRYFKTTSEAVRAADPNHLVMGCRFAGINGAGDDEVWNIAGEYCDVVSFNCYPMTDIDRNTVRPSAEDGRSVREAFDALYARTKKPMMIPEWAFPALDSGLPCLHGAGQRFYTQAERTRASELWMRTLLPMPYIVGWAVFRWVDQPAGGAGGNGEDSNYGLVNEAGVPYPCVETFARIQKNAKALRYGPPPPVLDAPPVSTRIVDEMLARAHTGGSRSCATAKVSFTRTNATCRVVNGSLVVETHLGGNRLLSRVALDGREFGAWGFMIHHDRNGVRCWTSPTRVTAADWEPGADGGGETFFERRRTSRRDGRGVRQRYRLPREGGVHVHAWPTRIPRGRAGVRQHRQGADRHEAHLLQSIRHIRWRGRIVRRETRPQPVARAEDSGLAREGRTLLGRHDGFGTDRRDELPCGAEQERPPGLRRRLAARRTVPARRCLRTPARR